jgi:hypothetical protein
VNPPAHPRRDLREEAFFPAAGMLGVIIATNLTGIAIDTGARLPAARAAACLAWWLAEIPLTSLFFLVWLTAARRNAATYPPGGAGAYRQWTVAGWICPVANLWIPYRMLAGVLRSSAPPAEGPWTVLAGPRSERAGITVLRWWCGLWHAMWAACLITVTGDVAGSPRLANLAFQALSIGAAACAIAIMVTVTRLQGRRAAEPYAATGAPPRAAPPWFWFAAPAAAVIVVTILCLPFTPPGFFAALRDLFVP